MIVNELYETILLDPIKKEADELFIVSGYASATFTKRFLEDAFRIKPEVKTNLIIGMSQKSRDHSAFLNLIKNYPNKFNGYYFKGKPEVHSKIYAWYRNKNPLLGYSGSANFSQYGFFEKNQGNQMNTDDAKEIYKYFNLKLKDSIKMEDYLPPKEDSIINPEIEGSIMPGEILWIEENVSVRISLLSKKDPEILPQRSGLNWGQRPEYNRDPNQAYLSIRKDARNEGFLPEKGYTFTLITDDNVTMDCTVQQDGRKGISTTNDNSELGKYFRKRLDVPSGKMIFKKDLIKYGRTDFLLSKLNEETFFLDFS